MTFISLCQTVALSEVPRLTLLLALIDHGRQDVVRLLFEDLDEVLDLDALLLGPFVGLPAWYPRAAAVSFVLLVLSFKRFGLGLFFYCIVLLGFLDEVRGWAESFRWRAPWTTVIPTTIGSNVRGDKHILKGLI